MRRRVVLWDIDGTLVRAGVVGAEVFDEAIESVVGRRVTEPIQMSGKTDPFIVSEHLRYLGIAEDEDIVVAILRRLEASLAARSAEMAEKGTTCPGVAELLERLAGDDRVVNSVLTGNIAPNAVIKLSAFGLDRWLDLESGAYGSDNIDRNALVPVALGRLAENHSLRLDPDDVWVVGDTPRDLECAQAVGAHCLLVATGRFSLAELGTLGADAVLADLSDTDAVIKLLTGDLGDEPD